MRSAALSATATGYRCRQCPDPVGAERTVGTIGQAEHQIHAEYVSTSARKIANASAKVAASRGAAAVSAAEKSMWNPYRTPSSHRRPGPRGGGPGGISVDQHSGSSRLRREHVDQRHVRPAMSRRSLRSADTAESNLDSLRSTDAKAADDISSVGQPSPSGPAGGVDVAGPDTPPTDPTEAPNISVTRTPTTVAQENGGVVESYPSQNALNAAHGYPTGKTQLGHIVEQSQLGAPPFEGSGFTAAQIYSTDNVVRISPEMNQEMNYRFSAPIPDQLWGGGRRAYFRMNGISWEEQYDFGLQMMQDMFDDGWS